MSHKIGNEYWNRRLTFNPLKTEKENIKRIFNQFADVYQQKYSDLSSYSKILNQFVDSLPTRHSRVLDIACGPGNISRYMLDRNPELDVFGIDIAPKMIELARINVPEARFLVLEVLELQQLGEIFDGVSCGFLLPYLNKNETIQLIKMIFENIEPGGVLFLSTMIREVYTEEEMGSENSKENLKSYFYTEEFLINCLENTGFQIVSTTKKSKDEQVEYSEDELILLAKRNSSLRNSNKI